MRGHDPVSALAAAAVLKRRKRDKQVHLEFSNKKKCRRGDERGREGGEREKASKKGRREKCV